MENLNGKQLFIRFLKQNNVYEQYVHNFNSIEGYDYRSYLNVYSSKDFFKQENILSFIDRAFTWRHTEGGWLYWYNLSVKWQIFYSKTKKIWKNYSIH